LPFPTVTFAILLVVVMITSWVLRPHRRTWKWSLLIACWVFYGWWDWRFVLLLIAVIGITHLTEGRPPSATAEGPGIASVRPMPTSASNASVIALDPLLITPGYSEGQSEPCTTAVRSPLSSLRSEVFDGLHPWGAVVQQMTQIVQAACNRPLRNRPDQIVQWC
jgi:hypothetical protein